MQWCNSWGGGCRVPLLMLFTRKVLLTYWEKRGKEKSENGGEKKENCKREGVKLAEDLFFFFLLFETTEICLESFKMETSTGKKHFMPGNNQEK